MSYEFMLYCYILYCYLNIDKMQYARFTYSIHMVTVIHRRHVA